MVSEWRVSMISELNMALSTFNLSDWWYDSNVLVHVCNDKTLFKTYEVAPEGHVVVMGNHETAKVHGIWTMDLQFTSKENLVLTNILYVLDMRKNLVSTNR